MAVHGEFNFYQHWILTFVTSSNRPDKNITITHCAIHIVLPSYYDLINMSAVLKLTASSLRVAHRQLLATNRVLCKRKFPCYCPIIIRLNYVLHILLDHDVILHVTLRQS